MIQKIWIGPRSNILKVLQALVVIVVIYCVLAQAWQTGTVSKRME